MSAWLDPYAMLLAVALAAVVAFVWWRWGRTAGLVSLLSGFGLLAGLASLWRMLQPLPTQKDPPKNPFSEAERERVRADIARHHKATVETRDGLDHAKAADTPDEQSARLVAMPRRGRAAPTMPPDVDDTKGEAPDRTPAAPRRKR